MYRIMLVDDEVSMLHALRRVLKNDEYEIDMYTSPMQALERLNEVECDLILSDYRMPEMNGVEFLIKVKDIYPNTMRLILSGQADMGAVVEAVNKAEIYRFLSKPCDDNELKITIDRALDYRRVVRANERLIEEIKYQNSKIKKQTEELSRLEKENPGITKVNWSADGSVVVDEYV
ncbi:MAG: response regulator [Gammaproteobacteria bacterium]|nr:response regulator [Gammaproteobacteria bacterium]